MPYPSFLSSVAEMLKQAGVGAALNYTAPISSANGPGVDPESGQFQYIPRGTDPSKMTHPESGVPNLLTMAPAGIYKLLQAGTDLVPKKAMPYRLYSPVLEAAAKGVNKSEKQIQEVSGVKDPSNFLEVGARTFGSIFGAPELPIPHMKVPAPKTLGEAATYLPKVAGKAAVELSMPGRQGGLPTAVVASGIGSGLTELADTVDNQPDYTSIKDLVNKGVVQPHLQMKTVEDYLDPETLALLHHAEKTKDYETSDLILGHVAQLQAEDEKASYLPPTPFWETKEAKEAAALGAIAVAGAFGARAVSKTRQRLMGGTVLAGQDVAPHLSDVSTKATQGFVQNDHMIREATARATGDKGRVFGKSDALKQWNAKLDLVTNPAIHSKQAHFALTGELPGSSTKTEPLGPLLDAIETSLLPAEKDLLTDGLLAGTALDDYKRTGVQTSFTHDRQGNPISQADVQHIYDLVQNDPKLSAIADKIRGHYRSQLDYMLEHGVISKTQYQDFITKRPNFVHMSKNEAQDTAKGLWSRGDNSSVAYDRRINMLGSRSESEGGGVTAGAAADPISELPNQWSKLIREVEIGKTKKQWLEFANSSPELSDWVKKLPIGTKPEGDPGKLHTVFENGMAHHYYVKDPALAEALNFMPFAQTNAVSSALNVFRRNFEFWTTGKGNPFFAPVAASYDTFTGMALKPKDYNLGVINEILAHLNPKLSMGGLDPTWIVSAPIGAARHGWDSLVGAMGNGLAAELEGGKGLVLDTLGQGNTQALQTKLSSMYAASIKSQMDEMGVANSNIFTSNRPDRVAPGLSEIAPKFATGVAAKAFRDAIQGDHSLAQQVLAGSHYAFEATRASSLARLYSGVLRSIHEGFRYQAYATNLPRIVDEESANLIASQTRRLAADIGQKGAGELAQTGLNGLTYANAGIQSLAQVARMFRDQPLSFALNTTTSLLGLAALYYGPALMDQEHRDKMRTRTEEQRMAAFETFGGLEVKVPPELRPIWGSLIAVLDDASGLNSVNPDGTDAFNPNFASAIQAWLDNGLSEPGQQDFKQNIKEGLWGAAPATWGSNPVINSIAAAATGLDISYSRYTGQPQPIKPQEIDPLGGEGEYTDDAISARWQKAIEDVAGTMLSGYIRAGLDIQRATKDDAHTLDEGVKVGVSRVVDTAARQAGPASVIFGDYARKQSANDGEMKLYQAKKFGFEKAVEISNKDILTPFTDGKDPRSATLSMLDPLDLQRNQELIGTALVPIGSIAAVILQKTKPIETEITKVKKEIDDVNNQKGTTIEERNKVINDLIHKRAALIEVQNNFYRMGEDSIKNIIGDPTFTFQAFGQHFDRYKKLPWPSTPPVPSSSEHETPSTAP